MASTVIYGGYYGAGPEPVQITVVDEAADLAGNTFTEIDASLQSVVATLPPVATSTALWVSRTDKNPSYTATVVTDEGGSVLISGGSVLTVASGVGYLLISNGSQWNVYASGSGSTTIVSGGTGGGGSTQLNGGALLVANNLSDLSNPLLARGFLGLGTASIAPATAFDSAGAANIAEAAATATALQRTSNLSDLGNTATAVGNLGLTNAAVTATGGLTLVGGQVSLAPINVWTPFTGYTVGQLVVSQAGAFAVGATSLMQCVTAHTSGATFTLALWAELADFSLATVSGHTSGSATATSSDTGAITATTNRLAGSATAATSDTGQLVGGLNINLAGSAAAASSDTGAAVAGTALINTAGTLVDAISSTGLSSLAFTTTAIGDVLMFTAATNPTGSAITALTGGGVTTWTRLAAPSETSPGTLEVWFGQVATVGSFPIGVTWSATPTYTELTCQEFHSTLGASSSWSIVNDGSNVPVASTSMTTLPVSATANAQLVWSFAFASEAGTAGTSAGFIYETTAYGSVVAYNLNATAGVAYTPTSVQAPSGLYMSVGVVLTPVAVPPSAPAFVSAPTITGTAQVPNVLTAVSGMITGSPTPAQTWQWNRAGVAISGATSITYPTVTADVGHTLTVTEHAANATLPAASSTSVATATVLAAAALSTTAIVGLQTGNTANTVSEANTYFGHVTPVTNNFFGPTWAEMGNSYYIDGSATDNAALMVWSIPLVCETGTLVTVAAGTYDANFQAGFNELVALGQASSILRIGWECYGSWFAWGASYSTNTAAQYVAAYQHVVTLARATPGANFKFEWNGPDNAVGIACYPGPTFCDYIGSDPYGDEADATIVTQQAAAANFVAGTGKPICFSEWGLRSSASQAGGTNDDPTFIQNIYNMIRSYTGTGSNPFPGYFIYYDRDDSALGNWPNSAALFKTLFHS